VKGTAYLRQHLTAARWAAARFLIIHGDQVRTLGPRATEADRAAMNVARATYDQTTRRLRALL
jgi:hypothetical protein